MWGFRLNFTRVITKGFMLQNVLDDTPGLTPFTQQTSLPGHYMQFILRKRITDALFCCHAIERKNRCNSGPFRRPMHLCYSYLVIIALLTIWSDRMNFKMRSYINLKCL